MSVPLLLYDGDCTFCYHWVKRWMTLTADRVKYLPYQDRPRSGLVGGLKDSDLSRAIHWVDGKEVKKGAAAVLAVLSQSPSLWALGKGGAWLHRYLPPFRWVIDLGYRIVASNRGPAAWVNWVLQGEPSFSPRNEWVRWVYFRGLGLAYLVAFLSLAPQIHGLAGSHGIIDSGWSDGALTFFWVAGALSATALVANLAPPLSLILSYLLYRILSDAGEVFFAFQWDSLLLEAGLTSLLWVPWHLLPSKKKHAISGSILGLWWLRILIFRVFFFSGWVKVLSGDVSWRDGTALTYHFESQPLPTPLAAYFHHLPTGVLEWMSYALLATELGAPCLLFLGRVPRAIGALVLLGLLAMISLTGNYGFFPLLCGVLLLTWFDDSQWGWVFKKLKPAPIRYSPNLWPGYVRGIAVTVLALGLALGPLGFATSSLGRIYGRLSVSQSYGVFAVMTRVRREVSVEGTLDGSTWQEYSFKYKPQYLTKAPVFLPLHMPRLDWQMWFAALGGYDYNPWFGRFVLRLLDQTPSVLGLLDDFPFKEAPPKQVRGRIAIFELNDAETRSKSGEWWTTHHKELYLVPYELKKSPP